MAYRIVTAARHARAAAEAEERYVPVTLPAKDFIFTQASIVSSVMLEDNSYLIKPETAQFVNANGDSWSNEALKANYETFIGAFNFVNHVQIPEQSVGFIADAVLRRIILNQEDQIYNYYVDILVATHRSFTELVRNILASKIEYLSMGCDMEVSTCSACGKQATDEMELCVHLEHDKGKYFIDKEGVKRITCELLGNDQLGTVKFIEASWLTEPPAFGGAVKRNILAIDDTQSVVVKMPSWALERPAVKMWVQGD